jgi:hypothetical protein
VAALRTRAPGVGASGRDPAVSERRRVERLILHGSERSWLRYLAEVTHLVTSVADGTSSGDPRAALVAGDRTLRATAAGDSPRAAAPDTADRTVAGRRLHGGSSDEATPAEHRLAPPSRSTAAGHPPGHRAAPPPEARRPSNPAPSTPAPSTPIPDGDRT